MVGAPAATKAVMFVVAFVTDAPRRCGFCRSRSGFGGVITRASLPPIDSASRSPSWKRWDWKGSPCRCRIGQEDSNLLSQAGKAGKRC